MSKSSYKIYIDLQAWHAQKKKTRHNIYVSLLAFGKAQTFLKPHYSRYARNDILSLCLPEPYCHKLTYFSFPAKS